MSAALPGWWPDPSRRHELRYWDGARWSDRVSDRGVTSADPLAAPRRPGRPVVWVVGALVAAVALVAGVVVVVGGRDDGSGSSAGGDLGFVEIPTEGGREVAIGAGAVWVASDRGVVLRIDPASGEVTDEMPIEGASGLAATDDAVWVGARDVGPDDDTLTRIDPTTNEIVAEVALPDEPAVDGVVAGPNGVWVVTDEPHLVHIDAATNDVVSETRIDGVYPKIAVGDDALWISPNGDEPAHVERLDRTSGETTTVDLSAGDDLVALGETVSLGPVAAAGDAFWVVRNRLSIETQSIGVDLCRVDSGPEDHVCAALDPLDDISSISFGEGAVWATTARGNDSHLVLRIDPETLEVTGEVEVPAESFGDVAAGEGAAWATNETSVPDGGSAVFKITAP